MGLLIRTLLIWLLVLAVPAQGAAAATMAFCGPNHHGGERAASHQAAPSEHAHHMGIAETPHGHHGLAASSDNDTATPAGVATPAKFVQADKHKCSACASCCSLGAILNTVLAVPAPVLTPTVFTTEVPSVDPFAADGPDRPPRIVLA